MTPGAHIYFRFDSHNSSLIPVKLQRVPHKSERLTNENVKYYSITKTQIGLGEDALNVSKTKRRERRRRYPFTPTNKYQLSEILKKRNLIEYL